MRETRTKLFTDSFNLAKETRTKLFTDSFNLAKETRTKLFTDSFNLANTQIFDKILVKMVLYTVQISNFNRKSAWKSITDQSKFSKLSRKACCLARCEGACQWRLELR